MTSQTQNMFTSPDQKGRHDGTPGDAEQQQPGNERSDTGLDDGPAGTPGPNDDDEGRGEDEGKGQDQRREQTERTDSNGRNPGESADGSAEQGTDDAS